MSKFILSRLALMLAFAVAVILLTMPVFAAPAAQTTNLPDFTLNAKTTISVTVAITDGQVIVIPVDLRFIAQNEDGKTDVSLISDVDQQAGIFIGISPSPNISATIQLPGQANATPGATAQSTTTARGNGTHVANRNANLRGGPGTNFPIVGRVPAGGTVTVVGQNNDGSWLQLDNGNWIASFLVTPVRGTPGATPTPGGNNDDATPQATETPEATETSTPEADDDNPDATPTADDQATTGDPAELAAYVQAVVTIGAEANGAVQSINALIANPNPLSSDWRNEVGTQLNALSAALDQYLDLTPVLGHEDLHNQVTDTALTCEQAVDYLRGGLENPLDIEPALATQSVESCAAKATDLAASVQTLQ